MSGTALDHRLVRDYLGELDAAMRGLPAAQARELKEQITAHLDDALGPDADDEEVAATLSRLGAPADLAAEAWAASGSSGPRLGPGRRRMRWRLAAIFMVPVVTAATLAALQISSDAASYTAAGQDQHLARLNAAVVKLTQDGEDERDLTAAYVARKVWPVPLPLSRARAATDAADRTVRADAAGIGAGYQRGTRPALDSLLASINDQGNLRNAISTSTLSVSEVIRIYTGDVIGPANVFSAAAGGTTGDVGLQSSITALAALLRAENDQSVQRAILYAALSARPPVLAAPDLANLQQFDALEEAELAAFRSSATATEAGIYDNTVAGPAVDASAQLEATAEQAATSRPPAPLTRTPGLDAAAWYGDMSAKIGGTRKVADQLTSQITDRADALRSNAAKSLLLTSIATLVLFLVLLITAVLIGLSSLRGR